MNLYSTADQKNIVDLKTAILKAFPKDGGLYMPTHLPVLEEEFIKNLEFFSFSEIAFTISSKLFGDELSEQEIYQCVNEALTFEAPLISFHNKLHILELFHGPTMAFKDFGARFMAAFMSHYLDKTNSKTTILVATSGDTGGAVAAGFYKAKNIDVIILYPSGKISSLQEKQLTTWGENITAIEINGVFDDCQSLVKQALNDSSLRDKFSFSSANSINIARLIPQSFYYFEAYKQLQDKSKAPCFVVPSGNFGNLTAGLLAKKMGLPVSKFIAATNENKVIPEYLKSNKFLPKASIPTLSNAMDVGNPSNFERMKALYGNDRSTWNKLNDIVLGKSITDKETSIGIQEFYNKYNYILDPHTAVGYVASKAYKRENPNTPIILLETAHSAKFSEAYRGLNINLEMPDKLEAFRTLKGSSIKCDKNYKSFYRILKDI